MSTIQNAETMTDAQREEDLQNKIADAKVEGWSLKERQGNRAILVNRNYGRWWVHLLLLVLTMGIGNVIYGPYTYYLKSDMKVVRSGA